jgi:hypothetical protein
MVGALLKNSIPFAPSTTIEFGPNPNRSNRPRAAYVECSPAYRGNGCLERTCLVAVADVSRKGVLPQSLLKIVRYGPNQVKISPKSRQWCLLS